ncbi:MAG: T9SS type A sorting domain-containing protein [Bacteroidota bacterium]|nr:T9SS type A sorting domain-containing protein [Bacteroidota bacterium]
MKKIILVLLLLTVFAGINANAQTFKPQISSATTICTGKSTVILAMGGSYSWYSNPAGFSSTSSYNTVSPTVTTTYYCKISKGTMSVTKSVKVTVNSLPTPVATVTGTTTICGGNGVTINATGGSTYLWSTGNTDSIVTVYPTSTTTYVVTAIKGGCTASAITPVVTVNPKFTPVLTSTKKAFCNGLSTTLMASPAGSSNYSWGTTAGYLSNGASSSISVSPATTTTYIVTVTQTVNTVACTGTAQTVVIVYPSPTSPSAGVDQTICGGVTTTCTGSGGSSYLWSTGSTSNYITVKPAATSTYDVTVSSAQGCTATAQAIITVNAAPTPSLDFTAQTVCTGTSATFTASGAGTGTYLWSNGDATAATTIANPTVTATYTVTVTDANACTATINAKLIVNKLPVPVASSNVTICPGTSTKLSVTGGASGATYAWSSGASTQYNTVSPAASTTYTVTVTNVGGCSATATNSVTVITAPTATATATQTICQGQSVSITAGGGASYKWNTTAATQTITVSPITTTTYTVSAYDANGCTGTTTSVVIVMPGISATAGVGGTYCSGGLTNTTPIQLMANSGANTYTWLPAAGLSATNIQNPTASPVATTTYTVTVNFNGCTGTSSVVVIAGTLPTAVAAANQTICQGTSATFAPTFTNGSTYVWSNGGNSSTLKVSPSTSTTYYVTVKSNNGCAQTTSESVTVNPKPTITVTPSSQTICNGSGVNLTYTGSSTVTGTTYAWSGGAAASATTDTVVPVVSSTYTVTGTTAAGCTNTAKYYAVVVNCKEDAQNITSNNNTFDVNIYPNPSKDLISVEGYLTSKTDLNVKIINILGVKVFENLYTSENVTFKKNIDIQNLPSGMYMMVVESNNQRVVKNLIKQ